MADLSALAHELDQMSSAMGSVVPNTALPARNRYLPINTRETLPSSQRREYGLRAQSITPEIDSTIMARRMEDLEAQHPHEAPLWNAHPLNRQGFFGYDYLIDDNWTGTEGQTFTTITNFTFKVYSTLTGAIDHAEIEGTAGRSVKSFFIVPDTQATHTSTGTYGIGAYWEFVSTVAAPSGVAPQTTISFDLSGYSNYVRYTFRDIRVADSDFGNSSGVATRFLHCKLDEVNVYGDLYISNCFQGGTVNYNRTFGSHAFIVNSFISVLYFARAGRVTITDCRIDSLRVDQVTGRLVIDGNTVGANSADPPIKIGRPNVGGVTHGPIIITDNVIIRREQVAHNDAIQIDAKSNNLLDVKICDNIFEDVQFASTGNADHLIHLIGGTVHRATIQGNHWGGFPLVAIKTDVDGTWLDTEIAHNIPSSIGMEVDLPVVDRVSSILYNNGALSVGWNAFITREDNVINSISAGTLNTTDDDTSYYEVVGTTVSMNTTGYSLGQIPLGTVIAASGDISSIVEETAILSQPSSIWDADGDTGIQVEESADEDIIRMDIGGSEKVMLNSSGLHVATIYGGTGSEEDLALVSNSFAGASADQGSIILQHSTYFELELKDGAGQLRLPVVGPNAGLVLGGDTQWYRGDADIMRTPDGVRIDETLGIGATPSPGAGITVTKTFTDFANSTTQYGINTGNVFLAGTGTGRIGYGLAGNAISNLANAPAAIEGLHFGAAIMGNAGATKLSAITATLATVATSSGSITNAYGIELVSTLGSTTPKADNIFGIKIPDFSGWSTTGDNVYGIQMDALVADANPARWFLHYGNVGTPLFAVDETGDILLATTNFLQFRDAQLKIYSSVDGQLDIDADTEVEITSTTIDLNGTTTLDAIDVSAVAHPTWSDTGITGAELEDLSDNGATTIHKHDHGGQDGLGDVADHAYALLHDGTRGLSDDWDPGLHAIGNYQHTEKVLSFAVGDAAYGFVLSGTTPLIVFDSAGAEVDYIGYDRGNNLFQFRKNSLAIFEAGATGIYLPATNFLQFRDADLQIYSSVDGQLDLKANTEIELTAPTVDVQGNITTSGTVDGVDIAALDAALKVPTRTIIIAACSFHPSTTNPCAAAVQVETAAQLDDIVLDFDATAQEYAFINIKMPDNYDGGTITARFAWFTTTGDNTKDARWGCKLCGLADSQALNTALGTEQEVTDAAHANANTVRLSAATPAITPGGTAAGGNRMRIVIYRDPTHGDDDLATDARLTEVHLEYTTDAFSD